MAPPLFIELVEEMKGELPVRTIGQLFGIAKSTYYRWKKQSFISRLTDTEELVQKVGVEYRFTYGWNCHVKIKKRKRMGKVHKIGDNVLNRNFKSEKRFKKLVTDITYLPFDSKVMY